MSWFISLLLVFLFSDAWEKMQEGLRNLIFYWQRKILKDFFLSCKIHSCILFASLFVSVITETKPYLSDIIFFKKALWTLVHYIVILWTEYSHFSQNRRIWNALWYINFIWLICTKKYTQMTLDIVTVLHIYNFKLMINYL